MWACREVNINEFRYLGMYVCMFVCTYVCMTEREMNKTWKEHEINVKAMKRK